MSPDYPKAGHGWAIYEYALEAFGPKFPRSLGGQVNALTLSCNGCGRCDVHHKIADWVEKPTSRLADSLAIT
jgi:hypothetical protein